MIASSSPLWHKETFVFSLLLWSLYLALIQVGDVELIGQEWTELKVTIKAFQEVTSVWTGVQQFKRLVSQEG